MITAKVAWSWASHYYYSNSNHNRNISSSNTSNRNSANHSRRIRIHTTKVHTAESNPTTRQPAQLEFDIMKTHCLESNTARDYHPRTLRADILDAAQDLRLGLVKDSHRVSHPAAERILYCETTPIPDPNTINELHTTVPKVRFGNIRLTQDLRERPSQIHRDSRPTTDSALPLYKRSASTSNGRDSLNITSKSQERKKIPIQKTHTREECGRTRNTKNFEVVTHIEPHNGRTFQNISFFTTTRIVNLISLLNWRAFLQLLLYCFILLLIISETAENKTLYLYLQWEGRGNRKVACIFWVGRNQGNVYDYSMVSWTHGVGRTSAREI
jgi:hypothetical protein